MFNHNVISTKTDSVTTAVKYAISYHNVVIIKARDTVVTDVKAAIFDQYAIAASQVDSVVSSQKSHLPNSDVLRLKDSMTPVPAMHKGITLEAYILTIPEAHPVRTSEPLFPLRIIAVYPVDIRALLTYYSEVVGIKSSDKGIAPTAGRP